MGKIKFNKLTDKQKYDILFDYMTGHYYIKEICEKHKITIDTFNKVVKEYELRSKTNKM